MAHMTGAERRIIPGHESPRQRTDLLVFHTMVGPLKAVDNYFRTQTSDCSHWGVGNARDNTDGVIYEWIDPDHVGAATLNGNWRVLAVECADNGAEPIEPLSPKQLEACANIAVYAFKNYGVPLVPATNSLSSARGIAYHRLGIDPWRVAGGEQWSRSTGKICPGPNRISQIPAIIARAKDILAQKIDTEEDDMAIIDSFSDAALSQIGNAVKSGVNSSNSEWMPRLVGAMDGQANSFFSNPNDTNALLREVSGKLDQLIQLSTPPPTQ